MSEPEESGDPRGGERDDEGASMRPSILSVLFTGLCFGVIGFVAGGLRTGLGVTAGGLLATANLWVFARVGQAFMAKKGNTAPWGVIAVLKMIVLFGGVWLILKTGIVSALSLLAGYAALPVGITVGTLFGPAPPGPSDDETPSARPDEDVIKGAHAERKDPR